jgi:DNA-binding beta-propeller fold protein YncE
MRASKQIALFGAVFAAVLAWVSPALASRGHQYTTTFGGPCTHEPCEGNLKEPDGVAVNEATKDVYVVDKGANRVVRYSASGTYESEFNGSETPAGSFKEPEAIAVDNSCVLLKLSEPKCKTEDPSNGDVYVVDAGHEVVDKYTAAGEYVGQITAGEEGRFLGVEGVAVDPTGFVYVYDRDESINGRSISVYTDAEQNELTTKGIELPGLAGNFAPGLAVDDTGEYYLRSELSPPTGGRISKLSKSGAIQVLEVDKEESSAVAVDLSNDNVLVDNLTSVGVFESSGREVKELERLGKENGASYLSEGVGVGVDASASTIYVADAAAGKDDVVVFGPKSPTTPKVESEGFASVTAQEASLEAKINPRSEPDAGEAATEYYFEYARCPTLDPSSCLSAGYEKVPGSAGRISPSYEGEQVSAGLEGLSPHTTYRFRAVARNSHNQENEYELGEELTFTTEGPGGELVLPDNRGWELVSPPDKQGARIEPIAEIGVVQAAASGDGITYLANAPTESQPEGYSNEVQVLSSRGSAWSSRDIAIPHSSATGKAVGPGPEYKFFNQDLTESVVQPFGEFIPQLSKEASESTAYLHDLNGSCASDCYHPLVTGKTGFANVPAATEFGEEESCKPHPSGVATPIFCGPEFVGASEDLSHVVLRSKAELTPGVGTAGQNGQLWQLYEWSGGALAPVSVLPGGGPAAGATLGLDENAARGAISSDGSRIAWEAQSKLYLRDMTLGGTGETVQLDKAETCAGCTSGGGHFEFANTEGSRVFFTDVNALTSDSGAHPKASPQPIADLYECQIVIEGEKLTCKLKDLTPKRVTTEHGEEGADVQGSILGASSDGSYVYFVADGIRSEAANGRGRKAEAEKPNLYVDYEGQIGFIATLSSGDEHDWGEAPSGQPTRVSPNGQYLELMSQGSPTGYDNFDGDQPVAEVYLYDAASSRLVCASCVPSGVRPVGVEYEKLEAGSGGLVGGTGIWPLRALVAANVPGWTAIDVHPAARYQPRYLNNEGRLFFNSADALVPQDSNGTEDVYGYEPAGIKGPEGNELCTEASETFSGRSDGCVNLISSGSSTQESAFLDASESGNDVFFLTRSRLSPLDTDNADDVYDAHVCTSASPCIAYPTVQSPPCTTEASCKPSPTPQPSIFGAPSSATFQGPGNLTPAAAVKAKAKPLTRAQKLAAALKACKKKAKAERAGCEAKARKQYGPVKRAKKKGGK